MWTIVPRARRWAWLPVLLALVALVWVHALPARASDPVLSRARARGYLIAAVPLWLPPFGAQSRGGAWAGLDVALARAAAEQVLGSPERVHLLPVTPGERVWAVHGGAADFTVAAFAWSAPEAPPAGTTLIGPYFTEPVALLVRRGEPLRTLGALDGQVVGVLPGTPGADALRAAAAPATPVLEDLDGAGAAAHALALGRVRALVGGQAVCRALAAANPDLRVQPLPVLGQVAYYAVAPADAPDLAAALGTAISGLPRGRALAVALAAWSAGADVAPPPVPALLTPPRPPA